MRFAELVKSPEHIHTYRITPLSLWNAAASGVKEEDILAALEQFSKYAVPGHIRDEIRHYLARYGLLTLLPIEGEAGADFVLLKSADPFVFNQIESHKKLSGLCAVHDRAAHSFCVAKSMRGTLKQVLIEIGYPVEDLAGFSSGDPLPINLKDKMADGLPFQVRDYQEESAQVFWKAGSTRGGSGVIALPCGAGKTIVGLRAISLVQQKTLIVTSNVTATRQWIRELLDKTDISEDMIGEYSGEKKEIRPITVATYQILIYRKSKGGAFAHMSLFDQNRWGLIIYDEVHLLPAPVFRATASIQSTRRLGLTATLVREDGREKDVFALIGPKRYDAPWKELEAKRWIAHGSCIELRLPLAEEIKLDYSLATSREQFRLAAQNPWKLQACEAVIRRHPHEQILVIGHYLKQLREISARLGAPLVTGTTPQRERDETYGGFRRNEFPVLVVSNVANFALDLPDASVAIQISGTYGSRQEEAQRLGRILRPKDQAFAFYTLVSADTLEQDFVMKRQLFLTEQGYEYKIEEWAPGV